MEFTFEMGVVLAVTAGALVLFVLERFSPDIVALMAVMALLLTGVAEPRTALMGFANPAVHTVAAMFVVSAGLLKTGVVSAFSGYLIRLGGDSVLRLFFVSLLVVVLLSAFINNTPIVVMMIPVILGLSQERGLAASKWLIPISYASIFGGCCTLIGTSTNLVVSGIAESKGLEPLGMFELAKVGLPLSVVGVVYVYFVARRILPERQTLMPNIAGGQIREYVTELVVRPGSPLIGKRLEETNIPKKDLRVLEVIRGEEIHWPPFRRVVLAEGDVLIAKGPVTDIVETAMESGVELIPDLGPESVRIDARTNTLAEVVIVPGSRFEGATVSEIGFHQHFGTAVLAIQRGGRHHVREKISEWRLRSGDLLLVQGDATEVERLKGEEGIILLEGVERAIVHRKRAPVAMTIAVSVIVAATFSPLPLVTCAMTGAILMLLTGCLSIRQLYRAMDVHTLVLISAMIGFGLTAQDTQTADWAAERILSVVKPFGPVIVLGVVYLLTNLVTEILSNAAAAVLMLPLALSIAGEMGTSPRPFLVAVAIAASAAFSTPVGYQTNTLVYGPGGYKFKDFTRAGLPLNVMFLVLATLLIPMIWPF